ncbi:MAG: hypothetical protein L3J37_10580 [Rhodobacteraceae bacterium]|nr:hypothetical protein [Paracoccaceae bacterium]
MPEKIDLKKQHKDIYAPSTKKVSPPDFVGQADIDAALEATAKKKIPPNPEGLRFESFAEGPCVRILHIGPFEDEGPAMPCQASTTKYIFLTTAARRPKGGAPFCANPSHRNIVVKQPKKTALGR